ncbi:MAG TPA: ATP-binding protein [Candidatus Angelobacter sp.]
MMRLRSLRWRIFVGAFLWTVGLLPVGHMFFLVLTGHRQFLWRFAGIFHIGLSIAMMVLAVVFLAAGFAQVRSGLLPFGQLRTRLSAVRDGQGRRIDGTYPAEVQPLVNDLNALLEHREKAVQRALKKAGDLAHGLKTPLAVLAQEADLVEAEGQHEAAAAIHQQVERMRRQVEYHLAHARAASSGDTPGAHCVVLVSAEGLSRTLLRIYAARGLDIKVDVSPEHSIRCQREDLDEMLGNLLDNACKWAKSTVSVQSFRENGSMVIFVDDDGPGIVPEMRDVVLQRGVRADEAAPGSGLGLSIVRDLAEVYGGTIALENSPKGGLRARLRLPAS